MRVFPILLIFIDAFLVIAPAKAQQTTYLNQYAWNPRLYNPARQGGVDGGEIAVAYRNQFQQLDPSERPATYLLHADVSPYFNRRIGLGVQFLGDKVHLLNRIQGSVFFAYHLIEDDQFRLSLGVAAGILNQKFNFDGVRVNDVLDLLIFNNQVSATRFDAGPGLTAEFRTRKGSLFSIDAATAQLFSSDIRIERTDGSTGEAVVYDIMPHVLATARYRYQGNGFAIEPSLSFRALAGAHALPAGRYDVNLNAYFLKDNRLMVGAGMRSDHGGYLIHLGVTPASGVRLIASGEWHSTLGLSFEVGATYTLGKQQVTPSDPLNEAIRQTLLNASTELRGLNDAIVTIRSRLFTIGTSINESAGANSLQLRATASDKCTVLLAQTDMDIEQLRHSVEQIETKRQEAERMSGAAGPGGQAAPGTLSDLSATGELITIVRKQLQELEVIQHELAGKCSDLRQAIDEGNCIRAGDAAGLQELVSGKLKALQPATTASVQARLTPAGALISYRYPDDGEAYRLSAAQQQLVAHIVHQINLMYEQGVQLETIELVTELQEDSYTLDYTPGIIYSGEFENPLPGYALVDNESGVSVDKTLSIGPDAQITLEGLGVLKLVALRNYLSGQGITPGAVKLQVRFNHSGNTYREETRLALSFRK